MVRECCPRKPILSKRELLTVSQSEELASLFKVLSNGTRLRMLHALDQNKELCVNDLAELLEMTPQAISNQLQRLLDRRILASRREGNNIFYRIADLCVVGLLESGLCLAGDADAVFAGSDEGKGIGGLDQ